MGKILLVGNYRSIKAWLRLQTEFAGILARLGAAGLQLQVAQRTFLEKKAQFEGKSIADDKKHNEAFEGLKASLEYYKELRVQIQKAVDESAKLLPLSIEATLAAKAELGIKIDEAEFAKLSGQTSEDVREILRVLMNAINDRIISQLELLKVSKQPQPETPNTPTQ